MAKLKIGRLFGRNLYIGSEQDFNDMEEGSYMIVTEKNSVSGLVMKSHGEAVDVISAGNEAAKEQQQPGQADNESKTNTENNGEDDGTQNQEPGDGDQTENPTTE